MNILCRDSRGQLGRFFFKTLYNTHVTELEMTHSVLNSSVSLALLLQCLSAGRGTGVSLSANQMPDYRFFREARLKIRRVCGPQSSPPLAPFHPPANPSVTSFLPAISVRNVWRHSPFPFTDAFIQSELTESSICQKKE